MADAADVLAAAPNWGAVAIVAGLLAAGLLGLVVGWQTRGHLDGRRRGGYVHRTGSE